MAGMGGDPSLTGMMHGMMDAAGGMDSAAAAGMNQMQMLMYFAQLGMMASMNGSPMSMPGTPTAAMTNSPMAAAAAAAAAGGMANPMLFNMMNPQQLAAFNAAQQHWQAGMPASAIANIAAAAAVAATAASNPEVRLVLSGWQTALHPTLQRAGAFPCMLFCRRLLLLLAFCMDHHTVQAPLLTLFSKPTQTHTHIFHFPPLPAG
jgi:hypothetical protein